MWSGFVFLLALSQLSNSASALERQFEVGLFQDAIVRDNNNIGKYRLGLQIDSFDRNRLCTTEETRHQNRELSAEQ